MEYGGTNAFFTQGYVVDYQKKKIQVEQVNKKTHKITDFLFNYLIHISVYSAIFLIGIWLINQLIYITKTTNYQIITIGLLTILTFFFIFCIYYINSNTKIASDLQMLFETPVYFFRPKTEIEIQLNNTKEVELHLNNSYWKYWLTFKGECTEYRDKILFLHHIPDYDNVKIIRFTKPVNGTIIFKAKDCKINKIKMR